MKWLPILLTLLGFNAAQAFQITTIVETVLVASAPFSGWGKR